ncbi:albusnodin family lasso peptide [Embleya scabrispora]|nr:albusnodin family lasso peptide [Embleya scabrispora]
MKQPNVHDARHPRPVLPINLGTAGALTRGGTASGSENKRKVYSSTIG